MYREALDIIINEGFPPKTRKALPTLTIGELVKLSTKVNIEVSRLAFYFRKIAD
jgi:hypothetical protein